MFDAETARLRISDLTRRLESLENNLTLKDAQLKEALSAVPSADETKRLAKLESDLAGLKQENNSLKASVDTATAQLKSAQADLAKAQAEATKATADMAKAQAKADEVALELSNAQDRIKAAEANASDKEIKRLQESLAERQTELEAASGELTTAKASVASLQEKLKSYDKGTAEKDLEAKVASLEKQLNKSQGELQQTTTKLSDAATANSDLEKELKALEKGSREKELTSYINSLEKRLAKAERANVASGNNQPRSRRSFRDMFNFRGRKRAENAKVAELQNQVKTLRARLEILDAEKVPLTAEEQELLTDPQLTPAPENTLEARLASIPAGQVENFKAGEANLFRDHQYAEAEAKFMHVLKLDENNPLTLSNLAIAQMEQEKYEDAQASLDRALQQNPNDPFALRGIGMLSFRKRITSRHGTISRERFSSFRATLSLSIFSAPPSSYLAKRKRPRPRYAKPSNSNRDTPSRTSTSLWFTPPKNHRSSPWPSSTTTRLSRRDTRKTMRWINASTGRIDPCSGSTPTN